MKTRNVKVGGKIVILHKGFDTESKWKKEGIYSLGNLGKGYCIFAV